MMAWRTETPEPGTVVVVYVDADEEQDHIRFACDNIHATSTTLRVDLRITSQLDRAVRAEDGTVYAEPGIDLLDGRRRARLNGILTGAIPTPPGGVGFDWAEALLEVAKRVRPLVTGAGSRFLLTDLSTVDVVDIRWLWPGWLVIGCLQLVEGMPDLGKSVIVHDIVARFTGGPTWPDGQVIDDASRGRVLYVGDEDALASTVVPRIKVAGGDVAKVVSLRPHPGQPPLELPKDIDQLRTMLREAQEAGSPFRIVVIDPLASHTGDLNQNSTTEMRSALDPLAALAAEFDVGCIVVRHWNKAVGMDAMSRGGGSLAGITGAARIVWSVVRDRSDPSGERRACGVVKDNVAPKPSPLAYHLVSAHTDGLDRAGVGVALVVWDGESSLTVDQLISINAATDDTSAKTVLTQLLAKNNGAMHAAVVERVMAGYGITGKATLNRARAAIGARAYRSRLGRREWWTIAEGIVLPEEVGQDGSQETVWREPDGAPDVGSAPPDVGSAPLTPEPTSGPPEPTPPDAPVSVDGRRFRGEPTSQNRPETVVGSAPRPPEPTTPDDVGSARNLDVGSARNLARKLDGSGRSMEDAEGVSRAAPEPVPSRRDQAPEQEAEWAPVTEGTEAPESGTSVTSVTPPHSPIQTDFDPELSTDDDAEQVRFPPEPESVSPPWDQEPDVGGGPKPPPLSTDAPPLIGTRSPSEGIGRAVPSPDGASPIAPQKPPSVLSWRPPTCLPTGTPHAGPFEADALGRWRCGRCLAVGYEPTLAPTPDGVKP